MRNASHHAALLSPESRGFQWVEKAKRHCLHLLYLMIKHQCCIFYAWHDPHTVPKSYILPQEQRVWHIFRGAGSMLAW